MPKIEQTYGYQLKILRIRILELKLQLFSGIHIIRRYYEKRIEIEKQELNKYMEDEGL